MIDFVIISADLESYVADTLVKTGAGLEDKVKGGCCTNLSGRSPSVEDL